jgi:hypothetical protein
MTPMLKFLAAYGGYVAVLHTMPGPWQRWSRGTCVDMWTLTHVAWSMIGRRMGLTIGQVMALSVANELGEAWVRRYRPEWLFGEHESPCNVVMDVVANWAGYYIVKGKQ